MNPRDFTSDRHRSIDDTPYGGGSGMVMMPGPVVDAMEHADTLAAERDHDRPWRVLLTPQGRPFTQASAKALVARGALTFICGRYEGIDERARRCVDEEISLGDFVLMGGEVAALALLEATSRLVPGVLGNAASIEEESHSGGWLEYPQYTRPSEFRGETVPEILLSGHHRKIADWRRREAIRRTWMRRPELIDETQLSKEERKLLQDLIERTES